MRTFKEEVVYPNEFESFVEAKNEVDHFITFYNHEYSHYALEEDSLEQFEISDERTAPEVASMIRELGYEPVWKDWDKNYI